MPLFEVQVEIRQVIKMTVEAEDICRARDAAEKEWRDVGKMTGHPMRVDVLRQIGEPWVRVDWYDLHEPGDVIVGARSFGSLFTQDDVDLLCGRIGFLGLTVVDVWNGNGHRSVSFRVKGRKGDQSFSAEERAILEAPRP